MTDMDYEQKYKDALEAARSIYKDMKEGFNYSGMEDLEVIFPELAESEDEQALRIIKKRMCYDPVPISDEDRRIVENWLEKHKEPFVSMNPAFGFDSGGVSIYHESEDERIRKELIRYFNERQIYAKTWRGLSCEKTLAYLEKQKEQTSSIPWVKSDNVTNPDKPYIDKAGWFYTTDGRMCPASEIEKQKEEEGYEAIPVESTLEYKLGFKAGKESEKQKDPHYTKRNALFDKCVENCDPAVMKKVSDEVDEMLEKEQKPEDVTDIIYNAISKVCHTGDPKRFAEMNQTVFKVAQRVAEMCQKPAEWNVNDKAFIKDCVRILNENGYAASAERLSSMFPVKPVEWSEEDEKMLNEIITIMDGGKVTSGTYLSEYAAWLKSLRPQQKTEGIMGKSKEIPSNWKPSEEDVRTLERALFFLADKGFNDKDGHLESIYNNIKKL